MDNLQYKYTSELQSLIKSFKPYYKWITFNTEINWCCGWDYSVLNLIING